MSLPGHNGLIALIAANSYAVFFNLSWGLIMWVMLGEMFPTQIRGSALAVAGLRNGQRMRPSRTASRRWRCRRACR